MVAESFNATAHAFASLAVPLKLRWLVCVLFAAAAVAEEEAQAEGRSIFNDDVAKFKASYKTLVELMYQSSDGRSHQAKKNEIARLLKSLVAWQIESEKTICTVRVGGRKKGDAGDVYHDSQFDLSLLNVVASSLVRTSSPSKMRGVVTDEARRSYGLPPVDNQFGNGTPNAQKLQAQDGKAAVTKAVKAALAELDLPDGGDPFVHLGALYEEMKSRLAAEIERKESGPTSYPHEVKKRSSVENTQVDEGGGCHGSVTPPPHENRDSKIRRKQGATFDRS
jgi:hypothetical protein